jgi:hypothetical protein
VSDGDDEDDEALILDRGNDPKVANAVTPQSLEIARECVPKAARVFVGSDPFPQITQDLTLSLNVEPAQIARGVTVEFDAPRH